MIRLLVIYMVSSVSIGWAQTGQVIEFGDNVLDPNQDGYISAITAGFSQDGFDPARIQQLGFGESQLLNNCRDGVKCSDQLHAVNRRLEFDFIREEDKGK